MSFDLDLDEHCITTNRFDLDGYVTDANGYFVSQLSENQFRPGDSDGNVGKVKSYCRTATTKGSRACLG